MNRLYHPLPLHYFSRLLFNLVLAFFGGSLTVNGTQNLPSHGPFIVVVNHTSIVDLWLLLIALPPMRMRFWIAEKWRNLLILGPLSGRLGGIFLDRDLPIDRQAIRTAEDHLRAGGVFGLAPEATRSPLGQIIRPKVGAAWLARNTGSPIVPIGVVGSNHLFRNFLSGRRTKIDVYIGEPFGLPQVTERVRSRHLLHAYNDFIMLQIARLLPEYMHGYYRLTAHPGWLAIRSNRNPWSACLKHAREN